MRTSRRRLSIRNPQSPIRNGFTLVEMLTVIGIIVLLVSILLPVVSAVRVKGHQADTMALLSRIASGAESYNADFGSYPGPLSNLQIRNAAAGTIKMKTGGGDINLAKVTMAENFAIGLLGGLYYDTAASAVQFDADRVGNGPDSLNPRAPKKGRAYMDKVSLTNRDPDTAKLWDYRDDADDADDSQLPEYLDKFPDAMPILILRAKRGANGVASNTLDPALQEQYDLNQIIGYTDKRIGIGREAPADDEFKPTVPTTPADKVRHGLRTVNRVATIQDPSPGMGLVYSYPYDLYGLMRHPSISMGSQPRQKDGFMLISAGADRIYGTKDDAIFPPIR
jgi:prepilin-type N-terminal cleavage/methylation domain-containing protein